MIPNNHETLVPMQDIEQIIEQIRFVQMRVVFIALEDIEWYEYNGSAIRSCLSDTLRKMLCVCGDLPCSDCKHRYQCAHSVLIHSYTPPTNPRASRFPLSPNPYLIVPNLTGSKYTHKGENFEFDFVLIGDKIRLLSVLQKAFSLMGQTGIGRKRGKFMLKTVGIMQPDQSYKSMDEVYEPCELNLTSLPKPTINRSITIQFETNLRLCQTNSSAGSRKKAPIREAPAFSLLLTRLLNRLLGLAHFHCKMPFLEIKEKDLGFFQNVAIESTDLRFNRWIRHSDTQQSNLSFDGLRGWITYSGNMAPWAQVFTLGQWLHVGSNTTFGLGKYTLQENERGTL
jgi:hypothetical protein